MGAGPGCLAAGALADAAGAVPGGAEMAPVSAMVSWRIGIVFTRFGSLTEVGGGADTSGATACADGCGAVTRGAAGAIGSDTGCSSRGTTRSAEACAPIRSWNGLLSALAAGAAGTVFAGVGSALMIGGFDGALEPDV